MSMEVGLHHPWTSLDGWHGPDAPRLPGARGVRAQSSGVHTQHRLRWDWGCRGDVPRVYLGSGLLGCHKGRAQTN